MIHRPARTWAALLGVLMAPWMSPSPAGAEDIRSDVTFAMALRDLAQQAQDSQRNVLMRDSLRGLPFYTPAARARSRALELQASIQLIGMGTEMTKSVERVLKIGGAGGASKVLGILRDAATSDSYEQFLERAATRVALDFLAKRYQQARGGSLTASEEVAKEALKEAYKQARALSKGDTLAFEQSRTVSSCAQGAEVVRVSVNPASGEVLYRLDAEDCGCGELESYHAEIRGRLSLRSGAAEGAIGWSFQLVRARYWGVPCDEAAKEVAKRWKERFFPERVSDPSAIEAPEENPCDGIQPELLLEQLAENEMRLRELLCRRIDLRRAGAEETVAGLVLDDEIERTIAVQSELFALYRDCRFGGDPDKRPPEVIVELLRRSMATGRYAPPGGEAFESAHCKPGGRSASTVEVTLGNVDDVATLYVNGVAVFESRWGYQGPIPLTYGSRGTAREEGAQGNSGPVDITRFLHEGANALRITLWNAEFQGGGSSLTVTVTQGGKTIYSKGLVQSQDEKAGMRFDETVIVTHEPHRR